MDCSLPGSSVHGILQARILKWVAISFSRGSSQPRDQTHGSCRADRFFTAKPLGIPAWCTGGDISCVHLGWEPVSPLQQIVLGSFFNKYWAESSFLWREDGVLKHQSSRCGPKPEHRLRTYLKCNIWAHLSLPTPKPAPTPTTRGFHGDSVVKNAPANAGDTGSVPDGERSHMPQSD